MKIKAGDFSHSDAHGVVSYKGFSVATKTKRCWYSVPGQPKAIQKAVAEAIWSLPNDASAQKMRHEVFVRLVDNGDA